MCPKFQDMRWSNESESDSPDLALLGDSEVVRGRVRGCGETYGDGSEGVEFL